VAEKRCDPRRELGDRVRLAEQGVDRRAEGPEQLVAPR